MSRRHVTSLLGLCLAASLVLAPAVRVVGAAHADIPVRLTDQDFWQMIEDFSEPDGFFRSENLVSNEDTLQYVLPEVLKRVKPGGVYLGVGPDQNFTYIAALEPKIAFITDIRRGNLQEHLMYKALLELSVDRAEFLGRLFSRKRPAGLGPTSTVAELFDAFDRVAPLDTLYDATTRAIEDLLVKRHGFKLTPDDLVGMQYILSSFYRAGPYLSYLNAAPPGRPSTYPSFETLQMADDGFGQNRSFLGTEAAFKKLKSIEERNLIVPIVGNFAGPKALKTVGAYVRDHGAVVTTFYLSNVEQYLFGDGIWFDFARNVGSLPIDASSTFIRSCFTGCAPMFAPSRSRAVMLIDSMSLLLKDVADGRVRTYQDVLVRSR